MPTDKTQPVEVYKRSKNGVYERTSAELNEPAKPVPSAKAAPKTATKTALPDPQQIGMALAESIIGGFVGSLKAQASLNEGHLFPDDVSALCTSFERQSGKLAAAFTHAINTCTRVQVHAMEETQSHARWSAERTHGFERLLVKQFAHLLASDAEAAKNPDLVSRRALPGIFLAVRLMAGGENVETYQQNMHLVLQRAYDNASEEINWDAVYADPHARDILHDLLVAIAPHFVEVHHRLDWLSTVINTHLAPVNTSEPIAEWQLSARTVFLIVQTLFAELRAVLDDDMGRLRITKRYGVELLETLLEVMENFEQEVHEVKGAA